MRITLLNTSIITAHGSYTYESVTLEEARNLARNADFLDSAIGHESTATILSELLQVPVAVNRVNYVQQLNTTALVFKLRGRPEEGKILNRAEIEAIGYDFGSLTRTV